MFYYFTLTARLDPRHRGGGTLRFYEICGLNVASEVALPGMHAAPFGVGPPDVTIAAGPVPASLPDATAAGPTWQIAAKQAAASEKLRALTDRHLTDIVQRLDGIAAEQAHRQPATLL